MASRRTRIARRSRRPSATSCKATKGVERVSSLGKLGSCGRINFEDKDKMWEFIKDNKGAKFAYKGVQKALWLSIEKTHAEEAV